MSFWEAFYIASMIAAAASTAAIVAKFVFDVFWRSTPRTGATLTPDREQLERLQAKRREALQRLGSRWVLHPNQPPVNWGYRHD